MDNKEALAALAERCGACENCSLCKTRTNVVFGRGGENAKLLFIGEAPGENEDKTGLPFVGAAGKLLDKYLDYAEIGEDEYYIANILKCRPPHNRDPLPEEEDACMPFLREQLSILKPKIIVCLGRISAMRIIDPEFRITKQHGVWFENNGVKIMAVYHPAALLRDPRKKEEMLLDFKKIREEMKSL
ncbi:MAG: uracil-DNA glycosylase [Clostridia bacterium]|nr:uracil-DNA glycosylase [Clostridia bacterium]